MKRFLLTFFVNLIVCAALVAIVFGLQIYRGDRPEILNSLAPENLPANAAIVLAICVVVALLWTVFTRPRAK